MQGNERIVEVNGIRLCTESFGDSTLPPLLLIHGAAESMLAWEPGFITGLVEGGRRVIRYDTRDSGQSTTFPVGAPGYDLRTLVADAVGLLDALGIERAHIFGMSQGAATAQLIALDHPDRVLSLVLASASPGGPGHQNPDLPGMTPELLAYFSAEAPVPDWSDRAAVVEYLVESERPFAAASRVFDTAHRTELATQVVERAADIAAQLTNPFLLDAGAPWRDRLGDITAPTLVLHGTEDPLFPLEHGKALAAAIPGAELLPLPETGHQVPPPWQWDAVVPALLAHTARS
ncbi:alpha/beta fold hydrolase [Nocardia brasiliensis]|uniref:alpha/beta fold hydrolase n=1 Tax=Nocardia brasiliensis TaxID=37326 RepID=UPI002455A679|nr:alpha/beta hydrolase [Nocardia brasiliensis]